MRNTRKTAAVSGSPPEAARESLSVWRRASASFALLSTLAVATLLTATINGESLWTDEAFSAFIASHRSLATCWSTLVTGDSSDLQMVLYYLYLHVWTRIFGQSEVAFRTANIPFILLYSGILVWASQRVFRSGWVWIVAALAPLAVSFASDTRPYFDVIALSLTAVACLLAYLKSPSARERTILPWLALLSLMIGSTFHMLTLLLLPPLGVLLTLFWMADRNSLRWQDWKWPLLVLSPFAVCLLGYFAWTFGRGATYQYSEPDLLSMASVVFRFAGLSGYSPNRRYDLSLRPFFLAIGLSSTALGAGIIALFLSTARSDHGLIFRALFCALATGLVEVFVLSFALHQQIEFRHLSCLLPLLLLLLMAGLSAAPLSSRPIAFAALALGMTWLISDIRLLTPPDYRREDFRSAVRKSIELHDSTNADIAIAADPLAAAYYGLDVEGPQPCFPLTDSCAEGFAKVPWKKQAKAEYALFWSRRQIGDWIDQHKRNRVPFVLLISRTRHQSLKNSAWSPLVESQRNRELYPQYGFYVYLVRP